MLYFFNGSNSIFLKKTSAPSDWNRILPLVWLAFVPALTTVPLRILVILSPSQMHSSVFHSPTGFSRSRLPRKPLTSFHSGSRANQLIRPGGNFRDSALGLKYHSLPRFSVAAVLVGWFLPLPRM